MKSWLLLSAAIAVEVTATLSLRAAQDYPAFYIATTAGYICAFWLLSQVLKQGMPLAVAYGVWGAVGVVLTAALGSMLFGDAITLPMLAGMILIVGGVLLVEFGRHTRASKPAAPISDGSRA